MNVNNEVLNDTISIPNTYVRERKVERKPKGYVSSILLGSFSLYFCAMTLYFTLFVFYGLKNEEDQYTILAIVFSLFFFGLAGLIIGTIGFIKARIIRKCGYYVTTASVLNLFGIVVCGIEIILGSISFILM